MENKEALAREIFQSGANCAQAVFCSFADEFGFTRAEAMKLASGFGAGMGRMREVCGAFSALVMISNLRQYEAVLHAQTELESAMVQLKYQTGLELYAEHIRAALAALKDLIGEVTPDDVLGIIFSKFCMGK